MRLFRAMTPESNTAVQLAEAIRQVANSDESKMDLQAKVSKLHGSQPKLDEDGRAKCERLREVMPGMQEAKSLASYSATLNSDGPAPPEEDEEEEEEEYEEEEEGKEEEEEEANPR
jgi:uncharacterized membrane protein YukC